MEKIKKSQIKVILNQRFSKKDKVLFYLVKGLKNHSNSIIIKAKNPFGKSQVDELNFLLRKELRDPAIELFNWIDIIGGLIPKKNIYKFPFFNTEEIKEYNPWRVCPIGEHWVKRHDRQKKELEDVDGHCRKNKSKKDILVGDEIELITQNSLFINSVPKLCSKDVGVSMITSFQAGLLTGMTCIKSILHCHQVMLRPLLLQSQVLTLKGIILLILLKLGQQGDWGKLLKTLRGA